MGFVLGFVSRGLAETGRRVLWIQDRLSQLEMGSLYGPGIEAFGLDPDRLLLLKPDRPSDALWAMEEALKCPGIAMVIGEFFQDKGLDLTTTRRLALAAREQDGLGVVIRHQPGSQSTAAWTRWIVTTQSGDVRDGYGGLGAAAFNVILARNRSGPPGQWALVWDKESHEFFEKIPRNLAATAEHGPSYARGAA